MSNPPAIPWERIRGILACHPEGLPTARIAALAAPWPGDGKSALQCLRVLRRHAELGHVRRAGRAALPNGTMLIWKLPTARRETTWVHARELRRLALMQRKMRALARMEEGIGELEQADRELAALGLPPPPYR